MALLLMALFNVLLPLIDVVFSPSVDESSLWSIISGLITPVMAPIFFTVILFDYLMSRVRAADSDGDEGLQFARISRIELGVIGLTMMFWIPFFAFKVM